MIATRGDPEVVGEHPVSVIPSGKESDATPASQPIFPEESILNLIMSSEPESIIESRTEDSIAASAGTAVTRGMTDSDDSGQGASEAVGESDEDKKFLKLALNVTEAMLPGFIDDYFRKKREERDEAQEEQEEERNSEDESAESSDDNDIDDDSNSDSEDVYDIWEESDQSLISN